MSNGLFSSAGMSGSSLAGSAGGATGGWSRQFEPK
jgi:hypothetical protein